MQKQAAMLSSLVLWMLWAAPGHAAQIGAPKFDHLTTGFELLDAHLNVPCESCHVGAVFKGTPRDCASCHNRGARITATFKSPTHVLSTDRCDACHTAVAWQPASRFDHQEVRGSCATCHNSVIAQGKSAAHIASSNQCDACHSVFGWTPVIRFDHSQITGSCATCHNGTIATGKPSNHIPTADSCDTCHSTSAWVPANGMHTGNISNCYACHNGSLATGKSSTHIASSNQCGACHTVTAWKPAVTLDHTQVQGSCASCHNGTAAPGLPANHFPISEDCGVCHLSTTAFGPGTKMSHTGIVSNCGSCHEVGMSWLGVTMVDRPTAQQDASHPSTGDCANCHASTVSFTLGINAKPANHIPTNQACTLCHTNPNNFAVYTMNHTGITNNCIQCHGAGLSFANIVPKEPPPTHIPTASIACEGCHSPSVFTSFAGTLMNHTPVAAMACDACHETGMSWFGVKMQDRPRGHHTGTDCKGCHGTNNWDSSKGNAVPPGAPGTARVQNAVPAAGSAASTAGSAASTAVVSPTRVLGSPLRAPTASIMQSARAAHAGTGGRCASCHNGLSAPGKGSRHIQSNDSCDNCHTTIAWLPARFEHQGIAQACTTCHNSVLAVGIPASHLRTTLACSGCHSTFAWLPAVFSHAGVTGACQVCHNGLGASGKSAVHMLTTLDCASCHGTNSWGSVRYRHTGLAYQGPVAATGNCRQCHKSNSDKVVPAPGPVRQVSGGRR